MRASAFRQTAAAAMVAGVVLVVAGRFGGAWGDARADDSAADSPSTIRNLSPSEASDTELRAVVARAWDDSIATWKLVLRDHAQDIDSLNLRFVSKLAPNNCYGLYSGDGPAYCSGNHTVFVGVNSARLLMAKFGDDGEAAITFLIGHEIGHHIQNINGRFQMLSYVLARMPAVRGDLIRRFELEADCYAGVWMHDSPRWAHAKNLRARMQAVLATIGDDSVMEQAPQRKLPDLARHGTSAQRLTWFMRGAYEGSLDACNTFVRAME
jgi:predicted metalloprotease